MRQQLAYQQRQQINNINTMLQQHKAQWKNLRIQGWLENDVDRKKLIFDMRRTGMSFREIADETHLSVATVRNDIQAVLEEYRQEMLTDTHHYIITELDRLDMLQQAFWEKAMNGDDKAAKTVLDCMKQRATLLGIGIQDKVVIKTEEKIESNVIQIQYVNDWRNPELREAARNEANQDESNIIDIVPGESIMDIVPSDVF